MSIMRVVFSDGRQMNVEPGVTFTGTDIATGKSVEYICFTDHRTTGPFFAKRNYIYYFKMDNYTNRIIYSDNAGSAEIDFVTKTLAEALDCSTKGPLCLFELVRGGIKSVSFL